jgi:hypothetical protein
MADVARHVIDTHFQPLAFVCNANATCLPDVLSVALTERVRLMNID